ncbi:MAG: hypothetical protein PHP62_05890, partial [Candidatus Moranbacteria bacterium]|nr:hypothetical protein [Candidatus Moranbacteria bacterium]
ITSEDIFHILPVLEIKKNFQRHEGEKFVQFLKTALSNQMEMIASIVVEIIEPTEEPIQKKPTKKKSTIITNVFSEKTFSNSINQEITSQENSFEDVEDENEQSTYTDKKTGHIYIQGENVDPTTATNAQLSLYKDLAKEKITQAIFVTKNEIRKRYSLYKKQLAKKRELRIQEKERLAQIQAEESKRLEEEKVLAEIENEQKLAKLQEAEQARLEQEKIALAEQEKIAEQKRQADAMVQLEQEQKFDEEILITEIAQTTTQENGDTLTITETEIEVEKTPLSNYELSFKEKLRRAKMEQQDKKRGDSIDLRKPEKTIAMQQAMHDDEEIIEIHQDNTPRDSKTKSIALLAQNFIQKIVAITRYIFEFLIQFFSKNFKKNTNNKKDEIIETSNTLSIVPHFSVIKNLYSRFNSKQKMYIFGALLTIFVVPLFIVHFMNKSEVPAVVEVPVAPPSKQDILKNEKNIKFTAQTQNVITGKDSITTIIANNNPTLISKTKITILQDGRVSEFPIPAEFGTPIKSTYMQDLSLIFIITDSNKVISFSPISKKFTDNKIDFANISKESLIGTYLTYMYVFDQKSNQIYRFPRADGGFGEKTNWLKDSISLSGVSDMTIDDNIYAIQNNQVLKFFKGQKQNFALEASTTPVQFSKLFTTPDLQFIYALDTQNSRLVQYSKEGSITAQFHNEALSNGISLAVDEKTKAVYIATPSGLISMQIQ